MAQTGHTVWLVVGESSEGWLLQMALQGLTVGWDQAQLPQEMGGGDSGDNRALSVPLETPTDKTNSAVISAGATQCNL